MKHYFLLAALISCLLWGCDNEEKPPIPEDKLGNILVDIHLADIYSTMLNDSNHYAGDRNLDSLALYYRTILDHHQVSAEDFDKTLQWYTRHSQKFDSVYAAVQPVIHKMEAEHPQQ